MSRLIHGSFTPPLPKKVKSFEDLAEDYYNAGAILNRFKDRSSVHAFNQATQNLISALHDKHFIIGVLRKSKTIEIHGKIVDHGRGGSVSRRDRRGCRAARALRPAPRP